MVKKICISLIRLYQLVLSPIFPPTCRFVPTCSQYAIDAVRTHGAGRGIYLAVRRILRCHPLSRGGYDPVVPPRDHAVREDGPRKILSES